MTSGVEQLLVVLVSQRAAGASLAAISPGKGRTAVILHEAWQQGPRMGSPWPRQVRVGARLLDMGFLVQSHGAGCEPSVA